MWRGKRQVKREEEEKKKKADKVGNVAEDRGGKARGTRNRPTRGRIKTEESMGEKVGERNKTKGREK